MEATVTALPTMVLKQPSAGFKHNSEWETTEDVGPVVGEPTLELDEFLKDDESYVVGTTMVERAKAQGRQAGQSHAERMLEQQDAIPVAWRKFVLVFAGTTRRNPYGYLYIACLVWDGSSQEWVLVFPWLGCDFDGRYRLVRFGGK